MFTIIVALIVALAAVAVFAILPDRTHASWSNFLPEKPNSDQGFPKLDKPRFPSIEGKNVDGNRFKLPDDFEGIYNVVTIAYNDRQLPDVNEWISYARNFEDAYPDVNVYELPIVRELPWFQREKYEFWMSSDVTDPSARATTITLFTDVQAFNWFLNVADQSQITIALVDRFGNILWQERGEFTKTKFENLENTIINLLENVRIYVNT